MKAKSNKLFRAVIFVSLFMAQSLSAEIAGIGLERFRIPQRFADGFLEKAYPNGHDRLVYATEIGFYVLGWSEDGKIACIEEQALESQSDFYFFIFDAVSDERVVCINFMNYHISENVENPEALVSKYPAVFDELILKHGIKLIPPAFEEFPARHDGKEIEVRINITGTEDEEYADKKMSYDIIAVKDGKKKILNSEIRKECDRVLAAGYVKSPYENRIAAIVIFTRYDFEDYKMFVSLYGCSLDAGFEK